MPRNWVPHLQISSLKISMMPSIVILDPELTLNLPADLTATTGMDALAHNLEAFLAKGFHPFADGIALQGMLLVKQFLPTAFKNGKNLEARSCMLVAASMGSTAFQKGLGAIHSLSHPINSVFNIHHGLTNAIFMPYVITFNRKAIEKKVIEICKYLQLENDTFDGFLNWILKLRKELNIPHTLSEVIDVKKIDLISYDFPVINYNINKSNNKFYFKYDDDDNDNNSKPVISDDSEDKGTEINEDINSIEIDRMNTEVDSAVSDFHQRSLVHHFTV